METESSLNCSQEERPAVGTTQPQGCWGAHSPLLLPPCPQHRGLWSLLQVSNFTGVEFDVQLCTPNLGADGLLQGFA